MKHKIAMVLLSGLVALSFVSCDGVTMDPVSNTIESDAVDSSTVLKETASNESVTEELSNALDQTAIEANFDALEKKEEADQELTGIDVSAHQKYYLLEMDDNYFSYHTINDSPLPYYIVDEKGQEVIKIEPDLLIEKAKEQGIDLTYALPKCAGDGVLYMLSYKETETVPEEKFYAINLENFDICLLWEKEEKFDSFEYADYYDGKVYMAYSHDSERSSYAENIYTKNDNTFEFDTETRTYDELFKETNVIHLVPANTRREVDFGYLTIGVSLERFGYVLAEETDSLKMIFKDGTAKKLDAFDGKDVQVKDYDQNYIIFKEKDENGRNLTFCYSIEDQTIKIIDDVDSDYYSSKCFKDGKLYNVTGEGHQGVTERENCHQTDVKDGLDNVIYSEEYFPGLIYTCGWHGWRFFDDTIYYIGKRGINYEWIGFDLNAKKSFDTGLVLREIDAYKYGTVETIFHEERCPDCDGLLREDNVEVFKIDDKYCACATKLNEEIQRILYTEADNNRSITLNSNCNEHNTYSRDYMIGHSCELEDISIINKKYLTIRTYESWYGGLADNKSKINYKNYLLSLETGKEIPFEQLYDKSEEEFKTLVANKVKEDFLGETDWSIPYRVRNADSAYKEAYDTMSSENYFVEYLEDGINVVFPYGTITCGQKNKNIFISYMELLGRDEL